MHQLAGLLKDLPDDKIICGKEEIEIKESDYESEDYSDLKDAVIEKLS